MNKIRVLHIMNGAKSGGISMTVLNMYNSLDKNIIKFDFAIYSSDLGINGKKLQDMGCKFYQLPLKSRHPFLYIKKLRKILKNNKYDAIHVHYNETSYFPLFIGKHYGIKTLIAHAHTYRLPSLHNKIKLSLCHFLLSLSANKKIACSKAAKNSIFGSKTSCIILKNAIDVNRFKFNKNMRERIRAELNIDNKFAIVCVGNLGKEKNCEFAIEVFSEYHKNNPNSVLIFIGDGPEKNKLIKLSQTMKLYNDIFFLGRREDVYNLLNGMDLFIMPSLYEGFGIAALEAIASGLPVLISDRIPKEFDFYDRIKYLSINSGVKEWVSSIDKFDYNYDRKNGETIVKSAGYDLSSNKDIIKDIYYN